MLLLAGQVDVILAQRSGRGGSRAADCPEEHEYLVAWKELPLEQATWETAAVSWGGVQPVGPEMQLARAVLFCVVLQAHIQAEAVAA